MSKLPQSAGRRRIVWRNVLTVISAAILIGAEVFGAAFAGGWAVANLFDLGPYGVHIMQTIFFICGIAVMSSLICPLPNFARACGRVPVGGHPDKRPDSRPERDRQDRGASRRPRLFELRTT
jgi:hypothetical protein